MKANFFFLIACCSLSSCKLNFAAQVQKNSADEQSIKNEVKNSFLCRTPKLNAIGEFLAGNFQEPETRIYATVTLPDTLGDGSEFYIVDSNIEDFLYLDAGSTILKDRENVYQLAPKIGPFVADRSNPPKFSARIDQKPLKDTHRQFLNVSYFVEFSSKTECPELFK